MYRNRILFFTHEAFNENLVQTQLFPFIYSIPKNKIVYLICFGNKEKKIFRINSNIIIINISLSWKSIKSILSIILLIKKIKPNNVHLRGFNLFPYVFFSKIFLPFNLILDPRGAFPEEIYMRYNSKILFMVLNIVELLYYLSGNSVIFVSNAFKNHIFSKYPFLNIYQKVIPTFYVENKMLLKNIIKSNHSQESKTLNLVYVGSMDVWQKFNKVVEFCNYIVKLNYQFKLHILTKDEKAALKYLEAADFKNFIITSVKPNDVSNFLEKMDIAFVFRDQSIVNIVSSPVKIQEYLFSGLFVVASSGIGDLSDFICSKKLGCVIDVFNEQNVNNTIESFIQSKTTRDENINTFLQYYENEIKINDYLNLIDYK
jgi:hypothetical protein